MSKVIKPSAKHFEPMQHEDSRSDWVNVADEFSEYEMNKFNDFKTPYSSIFAIKSHITKFVIFDDFDELDIDKQIKQIIGLINDDQSDLDIFLLGLEAFKNDSNDILLKEREREISLNDIILRAWIEKFSFNEGHNLWQIMTVISNIYNHKDRVSIAITMINKDLSLDDIKTIIKGIKFHFSDDRARFQESGGEFLGEEVLSNNCADIAIEWLNYQNPELREQYANQLIAEGLLQPQTLNYVLGKEDYNSSQEEMDFDAHNPRKRSSDFAEEYFPKKTKNDFQIVCKKLNDNRAMDQVCESIFENFIARNTEYLNADFLVEQVSEFDDFSCSEFLRYWISTYGDKVNAEQLCQFIPKLNPQEFTENLSFVISSIEKNSYSLEEICNINESLTKSATNIEDGGFFDNDSRVFEVKFRVAITWLGMFEDDDPTWKNVKLNQLCLVMSFDDDLKMKITQVFEGKDTVEQVVEDFKKNSRAIDDMNIEGLFEENEEYIPRPSLSDQKALAFKDRKQDRGQDRGRVNFYS